ncbi:MAG TPA: hypothetical protein VEX66_06255 [Microlunatus sp.]|nr:hypothetical protein [Microlunatus sp.]
MGRFDDEWYEARVPRTRQDLRAAGIARRALAGPGFERTAHGYHRRTDPDQLTTPTQRIVDALPLIPACGFVAGWAAAYVHGVNALDGLDHHTLAPLPVPILLPPGMRRRDTATVTYRQSSRRARGELVNDIPVTSVWRTIVDLTSQAPDLTEAVVAVDAFLAARLVTRETLERTIATVPTRRGVRQAREAIALARPGVPSTWETRLRIFAVMELGWTDLEANRAVFDLSGQLLGVPDLLQIESALAIEYDGASWSTGRRHGHRDRDQHREDNAREERLERAGLVVVRADKTDLVQHRRALADRLRSAQADGRARDRSRDRWTLDEPEHWCGLPA